MVTMSMSMTPKLGRVVGSIADTPGVHGVALAPGLNRGFTSNGGSDTVTVFELSSLKVLATLPTGKKPDAIVYDPFTERVFAANGESGTLTVIDAANSKVLATVDIGGRLEFAAVDGKGRLYVNVESKNTLAVVDTVKLAVLARYDLSASCDGARGPRHRPGDGAAVRRLSQPENGGGVRQYRRNPGDRSHRQGLRCHGLRRGVEARLQFERRRDADDNFCRYLHRQADACHPADRAHDGSGRIQPSHLHRRRRQGSAHRSRCQAATDAGHVYAVDGVAIARVGRLSAGRQPKGREQGQIGRGRR